MANIEAELQRVPIRNVRGDILILIELFDAALRENVQATDREKSIDVNCRAGWIVFRKAETATNVSYARFVQEPVRECARITDRVVLPPYRLSRREARAELKIVGDVRLLALIEVIPVAEIVSIGQPMVDAAHAVPEIRWPRDRDANRTGLDRYAIDQGVLYALVGPDDAMNVRQEAERRKCCLSRGGRFARSQRNARKRRISRGSWNGCRSCIRAAGSFSSAVGLQQD